MNEELEFDYERTDEQLLAYSSLPILVRLQRLDEFRQFVLMMREAPTINPEGRRSQDGDQKS